MGSSYRTTKEIMWNTEVTSINREATNLSKQTKTIHKKSS